MSAALIAIAAVVFIVLFFLFAAVKVAREYERGVDLPPRPPAARPEGPGPVPADPDRRPDGQGRPAHRDPERAAAGGHHQGQRAGEGQRRRLLPHRRPEDAIVQVENFMDATSQIAQTTLRSVLGQHMLDELLSERDKINAILQGIIDECDVALGGQGLDRRGQGCRDPCRHAARDGPPGRGRAGTAREGDRRRGRVPGLGTAQGRRAHHGPGTDHACSCATCRRCSRSARRTTPRSSSPSPSTCFSLFWKGPPARMSRDLTRRSPRGNT